MIYAINYDLRKPGQNYEPLHDAIKACGEWWHYLDSTWLVNTNLTADGIWKRLQSYVDKNDSVLIIRVRPDYQGHLPQEAWTWINERLGST